MRWINGAFDPNTIDAEWAKKLTAWIAGLDEQDKKLAIELINVPGYLITDGEKEPLLYYFTDEDFRNEHFAIRFLLTKIVRLANTADAYCGD